MFEFIEFNKVVHIFTNSVVSLKIFVTATPCAHSSTAIVLEGGYAISGAESTHFHPPVSMFARACRRKEKLAWDAWIWFPDRRRLSRVAIGGE